MDYADDSGGDPLDRKYGMEDFSPELATKIQLDCKRFYERNEPFWRESSRSDAQAGHDFWLTRNRHGAGFWDGDYPEPEAGILTGRSHAFGEFDIYVGDDGKLHGDRS